jgi:hypothetical protein
MVAWTSARDEEADMGRAANDGVAGAPGVFAHGVKPASMREQSGHSIEDTSLTQCCPFARAF